MTSIAHKISKKNKIKKYIIIIFALTVTAACYNLFLISTNIVTGGVNGIAIIAKHLFKFDQSLSILIQSLLFLVVCFIFLGKEVTLATTFISLVYPLLVKITEPLVDIISFNKSDMLIVIIFAGAVTGFANGLLYKTGYNSGGFSVLSQIFNKYFKISVAKINLIINLIIVLIGAYYFGSINAMYAIIYLYINSLVIDKVILGISNNKAFYIITSKESKICEYISKTLGHNITIFEAKGGFFEKKKNVLLTVIPSSDYYKVSEGIRMIDKNAFFVTTDSYEVKEET